MTCILGSCTKVPDAWSVDGSVNVVYETQLHPLLPEAPTMRLLDEIRTDILVVERETEGLLGEILRRTK